jgi:hypothetical protein
MSAFVAGEPVSGVHEVIDTVSQLRAVSRHRRENLISDLSRDRPAGRFPTLARRASSLPTAHRAPRVEKLSRAHGLVITPCQWCD